MNECITLLRSKVAGKAGLKLHIGAGYLLYNDIQVASQRWQRTRDTALTHMANCDFFAPALTHQKVEDFADGPCLLKEYLRWVSEAWPGKKTLSPYHLCPTGTDILDNTAAAYINELSSKSHELHSAGLRGFSSWSVLSAGADSSLRATNNGKWVKSSVAEKAIGSALKTWSVAESTRTWGTPFAGPSTCNIPGFDGDHVYLDELAFGWTDQSYETVVNYLDKAHVYKGTNAIGITGTNFGAWSIAYNPSLYPNKKLFSDTIDVFSFWMFTTSNTVPNYRIGLQANQGAKISDYRPTVQANTWTNVVIPMVAISATRAEVTRIHVKLLQSQTAEKFWVDNVRFIPKNAPTTTTVVVPPVTTTTTTTSVVSTTAPSNNVITTTANALTTTTGAPQITTTPAPCVLPPLLDPPRVPCPRKCCVQRRGKKILYFRMSDDYDNFDCVSFLSAFARARGVREEDLGVCGLRRGSSVVELEGDTAMMDSAMRDASAGGGGIPNLLSVTDPNTGITATVGDTGLSLGVIIGIAVGSVLLLLVLVVVVIILVKRRGKARASDANYQPLKKFQYLEPVPLAKAPSPVAAAESGQTSHVTLVVQYDVLDKGENVLEAKKGDIAFATQDDWSKDENWLWVRIGTQEGYVPRKFVAPK